MTLANTLAPRAAVTLLRGHGTPRLSTTYFRPNPRVDLVCALSGIKALTPASARVFSRPYTRLVKPSNFKMPSSSPRVSVKSKVLVFGAGNFGSCLADHLGDSAHEVFMWSRSATLVRHFNLHHRNPEFLTDHTFPTCITAVGPQFPSASMIQSMDVLLFAIPTQGVR